MNKLDNGKYDILSYIKESDSNFVFTLSGCARIRINAPHLTDAELKASIYVVIQNENKPTPILIYTPYSYKSACKYTVLD